jgi:arsenite methyltransferase
MTSYLSYKFRDTPEFISTFDEAPLWSAAFGLLLLKNLDYKTNITILDIGSGAGFPLMEIANRFGSTCKCYGLDVWENANNRAKEKIKNYDLDNVTILEAGAEKIPLDDNSVDLIVSNLGINNFEQPAQVFGECHRILKPGGKLAITTNLNGHWKQFYNVFEATLRQAGKNDSIEKLKQQQEHRGSLESITAMFTNAGFTSARHITDTLDMKFADGSAFLNHYFVKLGWLSSWLSLFEQEELEPVFTALENNLNTFAAQNGGLTLTVPMAFIEGVK